MRPLNAYNKIAPPQSAREQEATAFRLASRGLREATDRLSRNKALGLNHEVWSFLLRDIASSQSALTGFLKEDCLKLAIWSTDYSTRAVLSPDLPLQPLIDINETLAEGLEARSLAEPLHGHVPLPSAHHAVAALSA